MSLLPPPHDQVVAALEEAFPKGAKLIGQCDTNTNCWADLILEVQQEFSGDYVAGGLKVLAEKWHWKKWIITSWCPLTLEVWNEYQKAKNGVGEYGEMDDRLRKLRTRTIFGTVGLFRELWQKTRQEWIEQQGLEHENDPQFLEKIFAYLKGK